MSDETPDQNRDQPRDALQKKPLTAASEALHSAGHVAAEALRKGPRRLHFLVLRHLTVAAGVLALMLVAAFSGLYVWMNSPSFEEFARKHLIATLQQSTGCRVEIGRFHFHALDLEAQAEGLVLHGTEDPSEAPLATVDRLTVRLSILDFFSPRVLVRSLEVIRPSLHQITYPDGSTNLPTPPAKQRSNSSAIDQFFNLKASSVVVQQGSIHTEDRATGFDFQNRYQLIDFSVSDLSLALLYMPASRHALEQYRIEAGATDLALTRGAGRTKTGPVHGYFQATIELERNAARLKSLRITSRGRERQEHSLQVTGEIHDFAHPRWKAHAGGDFDLRLLDAITGYPCAPEGILRLDTTVQGDAKGFAIDGPVHVDNGAYVGTGVDAHGLTLDARFHADPKRMLIDNVVIRLKSGGTMSGLVDLGQWMPLPIAPKKPGSTGDRNIAPPPPFLPDIPMNGRVEARFSDVTLDGLLDMVGVTPFKRLGIGSMVNGNTHALWQNGRNDSVTVDAHLALSAPAHATPGEVPASGVIDATYTERDGSVALRKLELHLPQSDIEAHGAMGAYPMTNPSLLTVDLRSRNLNEFDTVLRELGVSRNGRHGTAALPIAVGGQAEFHGAWTGSLLNPKLAGTVKATDLNLELVPLAPNPQPQSPPLRYVHLDSVDGAASYSDTRVSVDHIQVVHGAARVMVSGSLDAAPARVPTFDANSTLHLHLSASSLDTADVQPLLALNLPITGKLRAQLDAAGPLRALTGSGWAQLDDAVLWNEPLKRLRVEGSLAGPLLHVKQATATAPAGSATASGSYDLKARSFSGELSATNLALEKIDWVRRQNWNSTGRLALRAHGQGTVQDPHLEAEATLASFTWQGEPAGSAHLTAQTAHRAVNYELTSALEGAQIKAHGQTSFDNGYSTQAQLDFSRFNIGTALRIAHVASITGDSSLAGTVYLAGPLARPEELRGEARLQQLDASISGVKLHGEGGLHALVGGGRVHLDPLHVTGDNTDMRISGDLGLKGAQQLDLAASGTVNLKLAGTLDPDLTASGISTLQIEVHGPLAKPQLTGRVDFNNGAMALEDMPNGLSQIQGTLFFNQNRLEVKRLTAMSGGGQLSIAGSLSYQNGLYADMTATGKGVRIRYPQGISSLADAELHLQGSHNNLLLSGNVLITRFMVSQDMDFAALAQASAASAPPPPTAPSNHVRLDVQITSSPQLNFQNAFAKLAGDVDLRLRGTLASPALLGRIEVTEGSATIAGTRYELDRGEIAFTNPIRIDPTIDLSATAHVEDYDIALGLHGTREKMAVTYRSDPPLPEADVVALLALGRTENQQRINTQQQVQALSNPTTDALLGGALNATVSSRVQKLFGAASVKVDPNYLGALGNSTSRIIVEEQLGRNLTLTYATNVNTTGQQLLQAEVAINRHVSLLVSRDESGVFSMVIKATRRYR